MDGCRQTTDGGALLLRQADRKIGLLKRLVRCFRDHRHAQRVEHELPEMLAQRIYALALGYEDRNDPEELRHDPLLAVLAGKRELNEPLAGKSTLNRLGLTLAGAPTAEPYHKIGYSSEAIDEMLVEIFLEAYRQPPQQIVLDLDAAIRRCTDSRKAAFFRATTTITALCRCTSSAGITCWARDCGPRTRTPARAVSKRCSGSSGRFARGGRVCRSFSARTRASVAKGGWPGAKDTVWTMCSATRGNERLRRKTAPEMHPAKTEHQRTGKPAPVFTAFFDRTRKSGRRSRRVVAEAEQIGGKENPRSVVTSLPAEQWPAQKLFEPLYCARGEMENRIQEQLSWFSDRLSTETMRANQLRLYLSSLAYVLVHALRRLALGGTEWAQAQVETIRLKLLKIAAEVRLTARRIWVYYSSAYPWKQRFAAWSALRC